MAVARIVGVVAITALSAIAAYFLYLKSKEKNEGEKKVDKNFDVSESDAASSSNTYKNNELKSVIPGDATVTNEKNKEDNETVDVEEIENINLKMADRPRRMSYRDALMASVDNEAKGEETETVVDANNQSEAERVSQNQPIDQSEKDSGKMDSMTSSVAFEFLSRPLSMEEKNTESDDNQATALVQSKLPVDQNSHSEEDKPVVEIISQSEPSPISMEESFVAVISNKKENKIDLKPSEINYGKSDDSFSDRQPSIEILETQHAKETKLTEDKIDLNSLEKRDFKPDRSVSDRHPSIEILETSDTLPLESSSKNAKESSDTKKLNADEEEVIDLACDEDDEDNDATSKIFVTEVETKRLTRGALKAMSDDVDDKEEITLLKESKLDDYQGDLDISDFSDEEDDDSAVASDTSEVSEILVDNENKTDDNLDKESARDDESKETLEKDKISDVGANPSGDVSKTSENSDKFNESLKIDLRPTWQVKKSNFVKKQDSTVSI